MGPLLLHQIGVLNMTDLQKQRILEMRGDGAGIAQIASDLGLSANTVKSFFHRNRPEEGKPRNCKECGKALEHISGAKPKTFCGDECRFRWWKAHRNEMNKRSVVIRSCARCGAEFDAYTNSNQIYCGHPCYIEARFGKGDENDRCAV